MANPRVRLVKRVKLTDAYTEEHLNELSSRCRSDEYSAFQHNMKKEPWRYCPIVIGAKGKYDFGRVKLPGIGSFEGPEVSVDFRVGSYHLDYREAGTRMWPTVLKVLSNAGRNEITANNLAPKNILDAIGIVERRLNAIKHGDIAPTDAQTKRSKTKKTKVPILEFIPLWLSARAPEPGKASTNISGEATLAENTYRNYARVLRVFGSFLTDKRGRQYMEDIIPEDLKGYYGYLATIPNIKSETGVGMAEASRNVKLTIVSTFLRTSGRADVLQNWDGVRQVPTVKRARNEETDIRDYSDDQIEAMFKVMDLEERELFTFFLCTGMRSDEVTVAEWHELDQKLGVVMVRKKWVSMGDATRKYWVPKYKKEREIPVPQSLFTMLETRRKRMPKSSLIFPTEAKFPKGVFLRMMKSVGHLAGLGCGRCMGCENRERTKKGGCDEFYNHRWRHTFACRHLRGNPDGTGKFDVKTVSTWLGHRSIAITERYLHAALGKEVQDKINVGPLNRSALVADRQNSRESPVLPARPPT